MRKRIEQLASGKFEYSSPEVSFSTDRIEIEISGGKDETGEFTIRSTNHVPMRGMVYTSCSRMECLTPAFEGEKATIRYQFHGEGLAEGDTIKGDFFLVLNQGEYSLSFVVSVIGLYAETAVGKVKTLGDFAHLAEENFTEAYRLFYSPKFKNILIAKEQQTAHIAGSPFMQREYLLYEGFSSGIPSGQKIEEFLIGIHKKKPVEISLKTGHADFTNVTETRKETIELCRSQWGYLDISVSTGASFLIPSKQIIREEDFIGSICPFAYYIDEAALHAGKNYGRLIFGMPGKKLVFSVCATKNACLDRTEFSEHQQIREARIRLTQLYIDYRLKKIVTGVWAGHSVEFLNHLIVLEPEEPIYPLMKAQALLINKQRQEASWILEDFKGKREDRNTPVWGYYLYLCTLMEREPSFVDRTAEQIEQLYRRYPGNALLFWVLLFLREEYCENHSEKLRAIEQWRKSGCISPFLYVEAYYLFQKEPYLLGKLGRFEMEVLNWAVRQEALTADMAQQVLQLVRERRDYQPRFYPVLKECYRVFPNAESLETICGYLIKGQCYDTSYHSWYELGIKEQLKMTGLYEAYLMSQNEREVGSVPKMIQMYFQYDSNLPAKQKAVLYVNIIAQKKQQPEIYQNYSRLIGQFAISQMKAGQMDDNLAVIYQEVLRTGFLDEEMADNLAKVLFVQKITCMQDHIARALVYEPCRKGPQVVTFSGHTAYFTAYARDYCVILEDSYGNRFSDSAFYQTESLLNPDIYIQKCTVLAPGKPEYLLYRLLNHGDAGSLWLSDRDAFRKLMDSSEISETFRMKLLMEMIRFCREKGYHDDAKLYLQKIAFDGISVWERRQLAGFLAEQGMLENAYRLVRDYGYENLNRSILKQICSYAITEAEFEEDDFLLESAAAAFFAGTYDEVLLIYLCRFYQGPTKHMERLWKAADAALVDTFELEERILTQMLYTTEYIENIQKIYDSYVAGGGKEPLCTAYLIYFANAYLVKGAVVPDIFRKIYQRYQDSLELNDTLKLALLKYFSEHKPVFKGQEETLETLLEEYIARGIYFGFYLNYDRRLLKKYQLYGRFFLEYHTHSSYDVRISFRRGEREYIREDMTEMYDGIFVREFVIFYGEKIQYYITESDGDKEEITVSGCMQKDGPKREDCSGSFDRLNVLLEEQASADYEKLKEGMQEYYRMRQVSEKLFGLL